MSIVRWIWPVGERWRGTRLFHLNDCQSSLMIMCLKNDRRLWHQWMTRLIKLEDGVMYPSAQALIELNVTIQWGEEEEGLMRMRKRGGGMEKALSFQNTNQTVNALLQKGWPVKPSPSFCLLSPALWRWSEANNSMGAGEHSQDSPGVTLRNSGDIGKLWSWLHGPVEIEKIF